MLPMVNDLNQINFNDTLILDADLYSYDFNAYISNDGHPLKGFCVRCEEKGCNTCPSDATFRLQNISHGATTKDVLKAVGVSDVPDDWHKEGVLFLMEGPSVDWGFYQGLEHKGWQKKPTREWYWVHGKQPAHKYPKQFSGGKYGELFNSVIHTFKLGNAYLTNLVKCGLNSDANHYKGIESYNRTCLQTCVDNILMKEIEILQPKVVFTFGSKVESFLWDLTYPGKGYPFLQVGLPHPAGRRRGFKDEYYRHLYFTRILEGLYKAGVVSELEALKRFGEFLHAAK